MVKTGQKSLVGLCRAELTVLTKREANGGDESEFEYSSVNAEPDGSPFGYRLIPGRHTNYYWCKNRYGNECNSNPLRKCPKPPEPYHYKNDTQSWQAKIGK